MAFSNPVQSVMRGLDILEHLARAEEGLTLSELASRLSVKPSTAYNLTRTLAMRGFVQKTTHPVRYHFGPAALELIEGRHQRARTKAAEAAVRGLFSQFQPATVTLVESVGGDLAFAVRMSPERPGALEHPRNPLLHAYGTASAAVFLAFWTDEERSAYYRRYPFSEYPTSRWKDPKELDSFLTNVRRLGYAALTPVEQGLLPVAAPVFDSGRIVAALGISRRLDDRRELKKIRKEMISAVVLAAAHLSETEPQWKGQ